MRWSGGILERVFNIAHNAPPNQSDVFTNTQSIKQILKMHSTWLILVLDGYFRKLVHPLRASWVEQFKCWISNKLLWFDMLSPYLCSGTLYFRFQGVCISCIFLPISNWATSEEAGQWCFRRFGGRWSLSVFYGNCGTTTNTQLPKETLRSRYSIVFVNLYLYFRMF